MASKLSSIDYSKRAKGVSKREYAASQLGGKLNYKTGQISVKKSTPTKKYSQAYTPSLSGDDADMGYIGTPEYQQYLNENNGKPMPDEIYQTKNAEFNSKRGKGIDVPTKTSSRRNSAQSAFNSAFGINTADASTGGSHLVTPKSDKPTGILGSLFMKGIEPLRGVYANLTGGKNLPELSLSEALGLTEKVDGGLTYNLGETPETDPATGNVIQQSTPNNIINNPAPYVSWDTFNQSQGNPITNRTDTRTNRNSQPVSQPTPIFQPAQSSNLSSILSPQSAPQDFSNNTQTQDNSMRQLLGNGYFSNGIASNGKGNYGIEGAMTGTDQNSPLDEILTLLGLKPQTALAAETSPQTSLFQANTDYLGRPYTGYSAQNGGQSTRYGIDTPPVFMPKNTSNEDYESEPTGDYNPQATVPSGGVAQQYAAVNPQQQYYEQAIKNAKKVMKETIKALEKEYKESEATGTAALNKQKREDLQAQSARFSFGLNQDPNSEQAIQYSQRMQNDYAGKLADFLKQLSTAKNQDISSAKKDYYSQKSSAQEKLAQLMAQIQQAQIKQSAKRSSGTSQKKAALYAPDGSYTFNERDPETGLKIFYDPQTNEPFINQ